MRFFLLLLLTMLMFSCIKIGTSDGKLLSCSDVVLQNDSALGKIRNHACEKISLSKTIDNYINGLEELNYENCPEEFIKAFQKHQEAWLSCKTVTDKYPELRGEMHDLFDEINKTADSTEFKLLVKGIWDTWSEVEKYKTN